MESRLSPTREYSQSKETGAVGGHRCHNPLSIIRRIGGAFKGEPEELQLKASPAARALIERAFEGIGSGPIVDYHAHMLGVGSDGGGAEVNPNMLTWRHPVRRVFSGVFLSASGAQRFEQVDAEYVPRLMRLARAFGRPLRIHLLAFDRFHSPDGEAVREKTEFYVPNDCVLRLVEQHPDLFVPVVSVHPARRDALAELERCSARGARFVKWLPSVQGMDPADPRNDAFYRFMSGHNMVLLTHAGKEQAARSHASQALGNPLRLRRPLDMGVRVIMAHCAGMGRSEDLDHPGQEVDNFDLFLRMMGEERYRGLLFGDISAVTQINRIPGPLIQLLRRTELHPRLVNGSDYPIPAINFIISTRKLARLGLLTAAERLALNEIYSYNPLLFDFVLKRTLREPRTGNRFPANVFMVNKEL